jgi:hypothetical protein
LAYINPFFYFLLIVTYIFYHHSALLGNTRILLRSVTFTDSIYNATHGYLANYKSAYWNFAGWNYDNWPLYASKPCGSGEDANVWYGVVCSNTGGPCAVTELLLGGIGLPGTIPPSIGSLTALSTLTMRVSESFVKQYAQP